MRIAITGGCGFIGSHLVELLHETYPDARLDLYDDLSRGHNIPAFEHTLYNLDLRYDLPDLERCDLVFHLAAKVTGIQYNRNHHFEMLMDNNAINTMIARALWRDQEDIGRVIWVSTACVYPHDAPVPTPESWGDIGNPEPTNWGYGVAKWTGEQMARFLWEEQRLALTTVRFFNAFGPRDYYDTETSHVAPALIRRVLEGQDPLVVWGTGNQSRVLVDARDIARALVKLAECPGAVGETVNIGHTREISISTLARTISVMSYELGYIEKMPSVYFDKSKPDGYARRAADTTKLERLIGYVPNTPLEDTLRDMIREYGELTRKSPVLV